MKINKNLLTKLIYKPSGSVFILVLMIIFILSILGLALATATNTNFIINNSSIDANKAYFRADGIMQQVYVILEELIAEHGDRFISEIFNSMSTLEAKESNIEENETAEILTYLEYSDPMLISITVNYTINKIKKSVKAVFSLADIKQSIQLDWIQGLIAGGNIVSNAFKCNITSSADIFIGNGYSNNIIISDDTIETTNTEKVEAIFEMLDNNIGINLKPDNIMNKYLIVNTTGQPTSLTIGKDIPDTPGTTGIILSTGDIEMIISSREPDYENLFKFHNSGAIISKGNIIFTVQYPEEDMFYAQDNPLPLHLNLNFDGKGIKEVVDGWTLNVADRWEYLDERNQKLKEIFAIIGGEERLGNLDIISWGEVF